MALCSFLIEVSTPNDRAKGRESDKIVKQIDRNREIERKREKITISIGDSKVVPKSNEQHLAVPTRMARLSSLTCNLGNLKEFSFTVRYISDNKDNV